MHQEISILRTREAVYNKNHETITAMHKTYTKVSRYSDTRHAKWKVEEPWRFREQVPMWFPSKSPGPCCPCDVNFSCNRRDRHARNTAREPALICASSEINPFCPERDSISIFLLVATRKIFTAPGNKRKTNCAQKERKREGRRATENEEERSITSSKERR